MGCAISMLDHMKVVPFQGVTTEAVGLPSMVGERRVTSQGVLRSGDDLHMPWVDALPVRALGAIVAGLTDCRVAQMIDDTAVGNDAASEHEGEAMREPRPSLVRGLPVAELLHDVARPRLALVRRASFGGLCERGQRATLVSHGTCNIVPSN
jgi:hypothetical protein